MRNRLPDIERMLKAAAANQEPLVADPSEKEASWDQLCATLDTIPDNPEAISGQESDPGKGGGNLPMLVETAALVGLTAAVLWLETAIPEPKAVLTQNMHPEKAVNTSLQKAPLSSDQHEAIAYKERINITDSVHTYFPVSGKLHKTSFQWPFQVVENPENSAGKPASPASDTFRISTHSTVPGKPLHESVTRNNQPPPQGKVSAPSSSGNPGQGKYSGIQQITGKGESGMTSNATGQSTASDRQLMNNQQYAPGSTLTEDAANTFTVPHTGKGSGWQLTAINGRALQQFPSITPPSYIPFTPRTRHWVPVPGNLSIRAMGTIGSGNFYGGGLMAEYSFPLGKQLLLRSFAGAQYLTGSATDFNFRYYKLNSRDTGASYKADSGITRYTVRNTAYIIAGALVVKEWRKWEISSGISLQYRIYHGGKDTTLILSTTIIPVHTDVKGTPEFRKSMIPGQMGMGGHAGADYKITPLWRVGFQYNIRLPESGARGELNTPSPSYPGKHSISLHLRYFFRKYGR